AAAPAQPRAAPGPAPAPPPPAPESEDADLKPGSRKDLWKCPHCGAGNKPDRDTCRSCGKSPSDPVILPWYRNNVIRAAILAVVGAVVLLAVWMSRVDLSMREPGPAGVDLQRPRISGSAEGTIEVTGDIKFIGTRLVSVSGRVAAVRQSLGMTWIALALGANARDEDAFKALAPKAVGAGFEFDGGCVLACVFDDEPKLKPGTWLSLVGTTGDLVKEASLLDEAAGAIAVRVDEFRTLAE
ncbi:MAG: zinc ribbon domain-containing protein, partial [Planctomycetes bacterium]|nr:zinc ribbon domain-containing protein [Planctomycetota bacterium]